MVMIKEENPINPDCPDYKCVPNLCAGTEDLSLNADGLRCELHLTKDTEGSCYEYSCERKFCDGAEDLTSDSMKCTAGLTSEGCYDYHCEQIAVDPNYCLDSLNPETDTTCQGDYVKTEGEGGCIMINCYVPCTPTCSGGTKALISDATTCKYECVKKGGKTRDGGDDGTDGGGGKTKVCKGRNCRRKNLRA